MSAEPRSPYAASIDEARETIVVRARYYKRLVIAVSLGLVGTVVLAAWWRSAWPLLALGLLPSLVLVHRAADLAAVHRWRGQAVDRWAHGELDLVLLATTLAKVPALPALTVQGMLEVLPRWTTVKPTGSNDAAAARQVQQGLGRAAEQALLVRALAWGAALAGATLVLVTGRWAASVGLLFAVVAVPAWTAWACRRVRQAARAWPPSTGLTAPAPPAAEQFNWNGVPARLRRAWPGQPGA